MLYTCRRCQKPYSSYAEHADGLCLYCRSALKGDKETAGQENDWREPLYVHVRGILLRRKLEDYDRLEKMLVMLGDYRDCRTQLDRIKNRLEVEYEDCVRAVRSECSSLGILEEALRRLELLEGRFDAAELIETAESRLQEKREQERRERERTMRRERRKRLFRRGLLAAACAGVSAYVAVCGFVMIPEKLRQADAWMAEEGYLMAYRLYSESETLWHKEEAQAGMMRAQLGLADSQLEDGAYEAALELYQKYGQKEKEEETYRRWSDDLAEHGDAAGAIEKLLNTTDSEERQARIAQLYLQQADEAAQAALTREPFDAEYARELGGAIDTIDAQLRFCHALAEAGVDLFAVYPDGVEVADVQTGRYRPETAQEQASLNDTSRVLLFERHEKSYLNSSGMLFGFESKAHDVADDSIYTVKLMAGELFSHPLMEPARRLEDATAIVFVDYIYVCEGSVGYWERTEGSWINERYLPPSMIYAKYPYFSAVSSISAYDAAHPEQRMTGYEWVRPSNCSSLEWRKAYEDDKDKIRSLINRIGVFEPEKLEEQMQDGLARIMTKESGGEEDAK